MRHGIIIPLALLALSACHKNTVYAPAGASLSASDLAASRNRAKTLNLAERRQIEDWITAQPKKFYPMPLDYWVDVPGLDETKKKNDGDAISYSYDIYDFEGTKVTANPRGNKEVKFGHFVEMRAVEDALRRLPNGADATLLVPSVLAFGTYGDNDQIPHDMPLMIKLHVLNNNEK